MDTLIGIEVPVLLPVALQSERLLIKRKNKPKNLQKCRIDFMRSTNGALQSLSREGIKPEIDTNKTNAGSAQNKEI